MTTNEKRTVYIVDGKVCSEMGDTFVPQPQQGKPCLISNYEGTRRTSVVEHFEHRPDGRVKRVSTKNTHYVFAYTE